MNTSRVARTEAENMQPQAPKQPGETDTLPDFLLSAVPPCVVELIADPEAQTQPSKTRAELLADGQCEV